MRGKRGKPYYERLAVGDDPRGHEALVARYVEWMRLKAFSGETIRSAWDFLSPFIVWCRERSVTRPQEVTRPILERYQRHLYFYRKRNGKPLGLSTQARHLAGIKGWFRFLTKQHYILSNPAADLETPRLGTRLPRQILSAAEVEQILAGVNLEDSLGIRDRAILELLYSTGLRRMELVNLHLYDLDDERGVLMIREGKGRKDRVLPIGERAQAWTRKYVEEVRPGLVMEPDSGALFLSAEGAAFSLGGMGHLIRVYVRASGVRKCGSCHLFRHTMATLMLEGGADIRYVQHMLGHADLNSTQIYTRVSISKLQEVHAATHPGAKLQPREKEEEPKD